MPRKRAAKGSNYTAADWDKFVRFKKGELQYTVQNPATPEERQRYACGVSPFGVMWSAVADAKNHVKVSMTELGGSILKAIDQTNGTKILGIERDITKCEEPATGFYPALCTISVRQASATRPTARTTSQISTNQYYKWKTRSAAIPMGRGDVTFVKTDNDIGTFRIVCV